MIKWKSFQNLVQCLPCSGDSEVSCHLLCRAAPPYTLLARCFLFPLFPPPHPVFPKYSVPVHTTETLTNFTAPIIFTLSSLSSPSLFPWQLNPIPQDHFSFVFFSSVSSNYFPHRFSFLLLFLCQTLIECPNVWAFALGTGDRQKQDSHLSKQLKETIKHHKTER